MEKREKIVKELRALKEAGFMLNIKDNVDFSAGTLNMSGTTFVVSGNNTSPSTAIERAKNKMAIMINVGDSEDDILEKIAEAKKVLKEYKKVLKHEKNSPDLIDYIKNNIFLD